MCPANFDPNLKRITVKHIWLNLLTEVLGLWMLIILDSAKDEKPE